MEEDPLNLETRRRFYEIVRRSPGISGREIQRRAGTARGETVYHLDRLVDAGLVHREISSHQDHHFAATVPVGERTLLRLATSPSARRILVAMLERPHATAEELRGRAGLSPARFSVHMRRLLDTGMVESGRREKRRTFALVDRERAMRILVTYRDGFGDRWVEGLLETWSELFPA